MVAPSNWTGLYIGINGGWVSGTVDTGLGITQNAYFTPGNIGAVTTAGSNAIGTSGGLAGGQIGYLLQTGSVVGGFEAAFDWMNSKGTVTNGALYPLQTCGQAAGCGFTITERASTDWLFTLLARVGFDLGSWYPYVTGGLAVANLKYNYAFADNNTIGGGALSNASLSQVKAGIAGGGGLEWRWDSHWSLRGEYLYMVFNDVGGNSQNCSAAGACFGTAFQAIHTSKATFTENVGRAALSYKW
jgi:outer membrane immunogenic protein